jgi:hypothetical protein
VYANPDTMRCGTRTQFWVLVLSIALLCRANDLNDDILTILGSADGASTFVSYLQGRTQLINLLNGGNFTGKRSAAVVVAIASLTLHSPRPERQGIY